MIDLIGTLRRLAAAIATSGAEITTIAADVANIDGDAMRGTDDATLQATWTDALATALANYTAVRAGYIDELDFNLQATLNALGSTLEDVIYNKAVIHHYDDSRSRVYPQVPISLIQIATAAAADTFGAWTQVVPINTIGFGYSPVAVMVEQSGTAATYIIQFGYSEVDGSDPTTAQIRGEQRFVVIGTPLKTYHADLALLGGDCPPNSKLWARLMSETVNADTCDISIVVVRHYTVTDEIGHTATWPWAS